MITAPAYVSLACGCGQSWRALADWCCPACGGPWEPPEPPPFDPAAVEPATWSLWRYAALLPSSTLARPVSLGEGGTPLVPVELPDGPILAKLEFLSPTGSYKDRGTSLVVSHLLSAGASTLVTDSSGNAAACSYPRPAGTGMASTAGTTAYSACPRRE
jgi:threonine synthase